MVCSPPTAVIPWEAKVEIEAGECLRATISGEEASSCCGRVGRRRIGVSVKGGDRGKGRSRICAEERPFREGNTTSLSCKDTTSCCSCGCVFTVLVLGRLGGLRIGSDGRLGSGRVAPLTFGRDRGGTGSVLGNGGASMGATKIVGSDVRERLRDLCACACARATSSCNFGLLVVGAIGVAKLL